MVSAAEPGVKTQRSWWGWERAVMDLQALTEGKMAQRLPEQVLESRKTWVQNLLPFPCCGLCMSHLLK